MKLLPLKVLTVFIILLLSLEICKGQLNQGNKDLRGMILNQYSNNESTEKSCQDFELSENGSRPTNHGEKVNTIVITCPAANYSEVRLITLLTLQKIVFSKKHCSIISHYCFLFSKTLHRSPLVNILRI